MHTLTLTGPELEVIATALDDYLARNNGPWDDDDPDAESAFAKVNVARAEMMTS